jgi:8-oxo-dGTP diphosphatase
MLIDDAALGEPLSMSWDFKAAITVLYTQSLELLMIRRAERLGDPWSGQIAFPGGKLKANEDLLGCALRELYEEVGVCLQGFSPACELDGVYPSSRPDFKVKPFVFRVGQVFEVKPSLDEVAEARWIRADSMIKTLSTVNGKSLEVYLANDWVVWGMSKRVLDMFFGRCVSFAPRFEVAKR